MKRFIVELGVVPSALDPLVIYCDNMGAIANAQEPRSHKRLKHIKLRYHSIREYIEDGEVKICKVHTDLNVADPLTKALPRAKHDQHQNAMGVSGGEEEIPPIDVTARTSMSRTVVIFETRPEADETSPPQQDIGHPSPVVSPRASLPKRAKTDQGKEPSLLTDSSATPPMDDPLMKEFVRLGSQFIGYRDLANKLRESLSEANQRADDLARKLEQSEKAREKAESDAAAVEGLRKRLHKAENALSENITQQSAREQEIITRLESQSRRFVSKCSNYFDFFRRTFLHTFVDKPNLLPSGTTHQDYDLENPEGLSWLFPYFFAKKEEPETFTALAQHFIPKEDLGLRLRQESLKIGVEGTIALVAESQQIVDWTKLGDVGKIETKKWQSMIKAAKPNSKKILSFLGCKPTPSPSSTKPEVK
ncbi:hypothetical protein QYE76_070306 [Lolium multiflorum]|uniref:Uncharacterized protein n=1 Tax=Lolium multiflorum TaxID=4521 RepID=A0AAD8WDI3_LOLMU|nr:hypothetical protein QYE76_070306 [Lolium multiflorum]